MSPTQTRSGAQYGRWLDVEPITIPNYNLALNPTKSQKGEAKQVFKTDTCTSNPDNPVIRDSGDPDDPVGEPESRTFRIMC